MGAPSHSGISDTRPLFSIDSFMQQNLCIKYFMFQKIKYAWNKEKDVFERIRCLDYQTKCTSLLNNYHGYSANMQRIR
jgi:hypothetical protein